MKTHEKVNGWLGLTYYKETYRATFIDLGLKILMTKIQTKNDFKLDIRYQAILFHLEYISNYVFSFIKDVRQSH